MAEMRLDDGEGRSSSAIGSTIRRSGGLSRPSHSSFVVMDRKGADNRTPPHGNLGNGGCFTRVEGYNSVPAGEGMVAPSLDPAPDRKLRIAIVGIGRMGMLQLQTWKQFSNVAITAVVDTDDAKAACSAAHGVPFLRYSKELRGRVDAAIIATPASEHAGCAVPLMAAGVHCLVEKPLAVDFAESKRLVAIAARYQTVLAVGHSERFNGGVDYARRAMRTWARRVEAFRMGPLSGSGPRDADVVQDLMIHDLDWVIDGLRELPRDFKVRKARWHKGALCYVSCEMEFSNRRRVGLTASNMEAGRVREIHLYSGGGEKRSSTSIPTAFRQVAIR